MKSLLELLFRHPKTSLAVIFLVTAFFASRIPAVKMYSDFADLLPQSHPYIQLHNEIRDIFGGANNVIVAVEVDEGTIFTEQYMALIHRITQSVDTLPGINHNLVTSLTHRTVRKVWINETGGVESEPYYDSSKAALDEPALAQLEQDVITNPRVDGLLVSPDRKAALIRGTLNEGKLDYEQTFTELQKIREREAMPGVKIYATGQPVLIGWVHSYVEQVLQIFLITASMMLFLLILYFRKLYGILLPTLGIALCTVWGLGILSLLGYNLDPLTLVVPFLISARAMSHGIQMTERYFLELREKHAKDAALHTFEALFRPGTLGVISDAAGLLIIALGSVPINTKLGIYASLWALSVVFTVLLFVPLALTALPQPRQASHTHAEGRWLNRMLAGTLSIVGTQGGARTVLAAAVIALGVSLVFSARVQIGESEPGSPLLYPDHDYNISSKAINDRFPGSEELFIVATATEKGGLKRPAVLLAIEDFKNHMLLDPTVGGARTVTGLVKQVNRILHNNDPRWLQVPDSESYVGGLLFSYMASSPIPGALKQFIDTDEMNANLVFYFKDHQGGTLRRAIHRAQAWIDANQDRLQGFELRLAGGTIGVTAAINEAAFVTNLIIIPLVFALIFLFVALFYWSVQAGLLMLMAMTFATALTYAYMGLESIGININTVPIIAVGVGIGIDYSIYIMDRIKEEMARLRDLGAAVKSAVSSTGIAVGFTAGTLILGIVTWVFVSELRFQADSALLLSVMLVLNAVAAVFLVPACITVFKPRFITRVVDDPDHYAVKEAA